MIVRAVLLALMVAACSPQAAKEDPSVPEAAARTALATVTAPGDGARVKSPLVATGSAPGDWYFEAVFAARLENPDGTVIAQAPAQAQTVWTEPGPKDFRAELPFTVTKETPATLVLEEDMPPEDGRARQVRVPVVLTP